jgi:hypothetical protein
MRDVPTTKKIDKWLSQIEAGVIPGAVVDEQHRLNDWQGYEERAIVLSAGDIAASWWAFMEPPFGILKGAPYFAADAIDIRETIMVIAAELGGSENLPAPLKELWEPLGVEQWEIRRLRGLRSWHAAARMTESSSGGYVPNSWPHAAGFRWVNTTDELLWDEPEPLFPALMASKRS